MISFESFRGDQHHPAWPPASDLRQRVFVGEQAVPFVLEVDARDFDAATTHIIGRDQGGRVVAAARLLHTGAGQFYVGRVVVDPSARSQGVGRAIIREAGRLALLQTSSGECAELHLDAQVQAIDFYVGCGYELTDEPEFLDAGIPHRAMRRRVCADS